LEFKPSDRILALSPAIQEASNSHLEKLVKSKAELNQFKPATN